MTWTYNNCPKDIKEKLMSKYDFNKIDITNYIPTESKLLSWETVMEIRMNEDSLSNTKLVKKYNLDDAIVFRIMNNQSYKMEVCPKEILNTLPKDFKINKIDGRLNNQSNK